MANYPIWQDVTHTVEVTGEYIDYDVRVDGEVIYNGRAYVLPSETTAVIPIASIAASYLTGKLELQALPSQINQREWRRTFVIYDSLLGVSIGEYTFYADWSYGEGESLADDALNYLSRPMQLIVDPRQYFVASAGNLTTKEALQWILGLNGLRIEIMSTDVMTTIFRDIPSIAREGYPLSITGVTAPTYTIKNTCSTHALYYLNAVGGWDFLLVRGNVLRENDYERVSMRKHASNLTYEHGESVVSEKVNVTWKLYTDYLGDEQWALMHHLTGSTSVYLHDLNTGTLTPVIVTDTKQSYNTYKNQGKRMTFAEIHIKASQQRYRR